MPLQIYDPIGRMTSENLLRPTAAAIMLKILMQRHEEITNPLRVFHAFAIRKLYNTFYESFPHSSHMNQLDEHSFLSCVDAFAIEMAIEHLSKHVTCQHACTTEKIHTLIKYTVVTFQSIDA